MRITIYSNISINGNIYKRKLKAKIPRQKGNRPLVSKRNVDTAKSESG